MMFPFQTQGRSQTLLWLNKERRNSPSPAIVAHGDDAVDNEEEYGDAADVGDAEDDVERSLHQTRKTLTQTP